MMCPYWIRSSHLRFSVKEFVLKNFPKPTGKHLCQTLFFNIVADLRPGTVNFVKFLKTPFSGWLLLWLYTLSIQEQNSLYSVDVYVVLILVIYGFTKGSSVTFVYIISGVEITASQPAWPVKFYLLSIQNSVLIEMTGHFFLFNNWISVC